MMTNEVQDPFKGVPIPTTELPPRPEELLCCGRGDACPHQWTHPTLPATLAKATADPHRYVAIVAGLGSIEFTEATDLGNGWVRLFGIDRAELPATLRNVAGLDRGLDVRLDSIVAAAALE